MKKLSKFFATVMTFCIVFSACAVPMTASAAVPQDETYEVYDVINYLDLKDASGNALSGAGTALAGGTVLTYTRTSPTGSAILKYRWTIGKSSGQVAGYTGAEMNLSFEEVNGNAAYMFGALFTANAVNYRPYNGFGVNLQKTLVSGSIHDIEFAKLKVKTGANTGKYYVYLKIDNEIIAENYTNIGDIDEDNNYVTKPQDATRSVLSNKIFFACHGTIGNKISQIPDYEYENYDTVTYSDLTDASGNALEKDKTVMAGGTVLKYTPASPTGSAVLKYRLFSGNLNGYAPFQISFEKSQKSAINYKFSANLNAPTTDYPNGFTWIFANNEVCANPFAIESNKTYDVEFARLKIKSGKNAGKYYVYLKINNTLFAERYVEANVVNSNGDYKTNDGVTDVSVHSGEMFYACHGVSNAEIRPITEEELYDAFDKLTLSDLGLNPSNFQNALPGTQSAYKATSASYSYTLKFYWRANLTPGTDEEVCVSPDGEWNHGTALWMRGQNFLFCYQKDWAKIILPAITSGDHLIEFGRKKVLNGKNQNKYYVYVMIDDVLSAESYETYPAPNNTIYIRGNAISKQRFADFKYSESGSDIKKGDFDGNGIINALDIESLVEVILGIEDISKIPDGIADFNEDGFVNVLDLVSMKKYIADISDTTTIDMISLQIGSDATKRSVVWCSNSDNAGKVQLALKSDMTDDKFPSKYQEFTATVSDTVVANQKTNTATITGLLPNTEYVYRVVQGRKYSKTFAFSTKSFTGGTFSFLAIGDSQLGITNLTNETNAFADTIAKGLNKSPNASFMISLGDQVNASNNEAQYNAFFSPDILKSVTLATVLGNHEFTAANYSDHFKMPNVSSYGASQTGGSASGDYWYVYDNVLFIGINTNNANANEHEAFMTAAISANPNVCWKVVTMHHSLYSVGHGIEATPDAITALRNSFAPLFSSLGIDVVLSAHDHSYSRTYMMNGTTPVSENGVQSSVTNPQSGEVLYVSLSSSSGSMFLGLANGDYPYCAVKSGEQIPNVSVVDITDTSFKITTYRTSNMTVVDEFTIYKTN